MKPVSIIVTVYNAQKTIKRVLESIFNQDYSGLIEVIVVNDGSLDNSGKLIEDFQMQGNLKIINQSNQGAVSATNNGFRTASYDIICSIDSDVVIHRDWLKRVVEEFDDPDVGAVQGYYKTPKNISFLPRMSGYDMEKRYDDIRGKYVTQVNTGNTAYRRAALDKVGLFDPILIYAYDNDMSYRLSKAGYKLIFKKSAICDHYWKSSLKSYIKQQYWSAYGRMQVINKHRDKILGDTTSGPRMIFQIPIILTAVFFLILGLMMWSFNLNSYAFWMSGFLWIMLFVDRLFFSLEIAKKQKDISAVLLPFVHLLRNLIWSWAFLNWVFNQYIGRAKIEL